MPSIGPLEVLVVAIIALLVFGPEKLPQIAKQIGRAAAEFKRMATEVRDEFDSGFDHEAEDEDRQRKSHEARGARDRSGHPSDPEDEGS